MRSALQIWLLFGAGWLFWGWGFYAHRHINRMAVFTLPPPLIAFYKKHIEYITDASVNPDRRRFALPDEAPRHYIDIDHFGDSAVYTMPRRWQDAVAKYGEDTLKAYGILPWHLPVVYYRLRDAFFMRDADMILRLSADLGHYVADAHVPLHTTENYNGQLSGQVGIHAFWESRVPELLAGDYDFWVGRAQYVPDVVQSVWQAVVQAHRAVDTVLMAERLLTEKFGDRKYSFETRGRQTVRVYSAEFTRAYHQALNGMVERQMRAAIKMIGDLWYSAWVDAGQPNVQELLYYTPTTQELEQRRRELEEWKNGTLRVRPHETENDR
jgi:hypothetical protein